jgi:predicted deacetylase
LAKRSGNRLTLFARSTPPNFASMTSVATAEFLPVAIATAAKNFAVVSIHDVAPSTREIAAKIISEVTSCGVRVCSLLVVPDYHRRGAFSRDREFVAWLRRLEGEGHEIVMHGYFHERPAAARDSLANKLITQFYTQGEGEFYDLPYNEAFRRITKAADEFRRAGLQPRGFIAPAWLLNREGERAARDAGMEYTTRLGTVHDLRSGVVFSARSLVYSVRNAWRRTASLAWNSVLATMLSQQPLLRLSIHPPDYLHRRVWRQILDFVNEMHARRTPTTYQEWIAQRRIQSK